jgi:hypothetical protein
MRNQLAILMVGFMAIMATPKSSQAEPSWQVLVAFRKNRRVATQAATAN